MYIYSITFIVGILTALGILLMVAMFDADKTSKVRTAYDMVCTENNLYYKRCENSEVICYYRYGEQSCKWKVAK